MKPCPIRPSGEFLLGSHDGMEHWRAAAAAQVWSERSTRSSLQYKRKCCDFWRSEETVDGRTRSGGSEAFSLWRERRKEGARQQRQHAITHLRSTICALA